MTLGFERQSDQVSTTGQITLAAIPTIRVAGFHSIIMNRPDAEAGGLHPSSDTVRRAAEANGLTFEYLPVVPNPPKSRSQLFRALLGMLPGPVLDFCASGSRSANLFTRSLIRRDSGA